MNRVARKLRSKSGASIFLALVYMIFAIFVGGTVLAAAAANGYRLEHMSDEQEYLDQRSAASLMADSLRGNGDLKLTIIDIQQTIQPVRFDPAVPSVPPVPVGDPIINHTITLKTPSYVAMSPMQRVMMEATVWKYLHDVGASQSDVDSAIELSGFVMADGNSPTKMGEFWQWYDLSSASMEVGGEIKLSGSGEIIADNTAFFTCGAENGYDFNITFEEGQLDIHLDAYVGMRNPVTNELPAAEYAESSTKYATITTTTTQTAITWGEPVIAKVGA